MRTIAIGVVLFIITVTLLFPSRVTAGGWTTVTLDELPANKKAGESFALGFVVRQHGVTPIDLNSQEAPVWITFRHPQSAHQIRVEAEKQGEIGHYVAQVKLPSPTAWELAVRPGLFPAVQVATVEISPGATDWWRTENELLNWMGAIGAVVLLMFAGLKLRPIENMMPGRWKFRPLWLLVNGMGLILAARLAWMVWAAPFVSGWILFRDSASENIVQFAGQTALIFLLLSLACTPLSILGWKKAVTVRKSLGLWGFGFGAFHSLYFLGGKGILFKAEAWENVWFAMTNIMAPGIFFKVPFARFGLVGLLLLIPLALTSNRWAMRRLGKNWKRLHRLIYAAVPLLVWHYWQRETWESTLGMDRTADWTQPVIFALLVGVLLVVRIPRVRKWIGIQSRPIMQWNESKEKI